MRSSIQKRGKEKRRSKVKTIHPDPEISVVQYGSSIVPQYGH
jgi:hypothetical protein